MSRTLRSSALLPWLAALALGACVKPIDCSQDTDCPAGGVCDPELKFCVTRCTGDDQCASGERCDVGRRVCVAPGGGSGGGTGGGGGPVNSCAAARCEAWQSCQPSLDGGLCRDVTLSVSSPGAGFSLGTGETFTLAGTVIQWDGGAAAGSVPVQVDGGFSGAPSLALGPGGFSGTYSVVASGTYTLWVGWDGGVQQGVQVAAQGCERASCAAWQTCQPSLDGGLCRDVTVTLLAPVDGVDVQVGGRVGFHATVTQWDGGPFLGPMPVASPGFASGPPSPLPSDAGHYAGTYQLPASPSGPYTLTAGAGWGAGLAQSATVYATGCEVAVCAEWAECVPTRTGGACQPLGLVLTILQPTGQTVGPGALVQLAATLTRPDGGAVPASVPWTRATQAPTSGLLDAASGYTSNVVGGSTSATHTFTVGWQDGGPTRTASYTVDATPPAFTVAVPAAPVYPGDAGGFWPNDPSGPAYRRDETVEVEVYSTDTDVQASSVSLTAQFATDGLVVVDGGVRTACAVNTGAAFCTRFPVEVGQVPMKRFSGPLTFRANGSDVRGNPATAASGTAQVTRWQWARQVDPAAGSLRASPAVDKTGTVYLALTTTAGGLVAVSPSGVQGASTADGLTDVSPAIARNASGTEFVFYESGVTTGGTLRGLGISQPCGPAGTTAPHGSIAILSDSTADFMGVSMGGAGLLNRVVGLDGTGSCYYSPNNRPPMSFPGNLVTSGSSVYWGDSTGTLHSANYVIGVSFVLDSASQSPGGGTVNGLIKLESGAGPQLGGGSGGTGTGRLYSYPLALTSTPWSPTPGYATAPTSGPVATASGVTAALQGSSLMLRVLRVDADAGVKQALTAELPGTAFTGSQVPSPVAGEGGQLYVLDQNGTLAVLPQSFPDGQATWTWGAPLPPSLATTVSASPTLTCNTRKPGTKTGVLSIATESGWLVTYLVDSRGLDPTAPWPKYGHDVRNTNNAATPIETCP